MTEYLEDGKPIENNENDECYWPLDAKQGVAKEDNCGHFCSSRLQQQIEDHRVILVASSPFFQTIFQKNKHIHPLIYIRGVRSNTLTALVDFLDYGKHMLIKKIWTLFLQLQKNYSWKAYRAPRTKMLLMKQKKMFCLINQKRPAGQTNQAQKADQHQQTSPAKVTKML